MQQLLTHQIKINTVIHQVIHPGLRPFGRAEIDPVLLAHVLDLLPRARQAQDAWVEFCEVGFQDGGRVARGIAGYEEG